MQGRKKPPFEPRSLLYAVNTSDSLSAGSLMFYLCRAAVGFGEGVEMSLMRCMLQGFNAVAVAGTKGVDRSGDMASEREKRIM